MKIYVRTADLKRPLRLWLPTSLMKSKLVHHHLGLKDEHSQVSNLFGRDAYRVLRKYIKKNGHFTLVDVVTKEGDKIVIKV